MAPLGYATDSQYGPVDAPTRIDASFNAGKPEDADSAGSDAGASDAGSAGSTPVIAKDEARSTRGRSPLSAAPPTPWHTPQAAADSEEAPAMEQADDAEAVPTPYLSPDFAPHSDDAAQGACDEQAPVEEGSFAFAASISSEGSPTNLQAGAAAWPEAGAAAVGGGAGAADPRACSPVQGLLARFEQAAVEEGKRGGGSPQGSCASSGVDSCMQVLSDCDTECGGSGAGSEAGSSSGVQVGSPDGVDAGEQLAGSASPGSAVKSRAHSLMARTPEQPSDDPDADIDCCMGSPPRSGADGSGAAAGAVAPASDAAAAGVVELPEVGRLGLQASVDAGEQMSGSRQASVGSISLAGGDATADSLDDCQSGDQDAGSSTVRRQAAAAAGGAASPQQGATAAAPPLPQASASPGKAAPRVRWSAKFGAGLLPSWPSLAASGSEAASRPGSSFAFAQGERGSDAMLRASAPALSSVMAGEDAGAAAAGGASPTADTAMPGDRDASLGGRFTPPQSPDCLHGSVQWRPLPATSPGSKRGSALRASAPGVLTPRSAQRAQQGGGKGASAGSDAWRIADNGLFDVADAE